MKSVFVFSVACLAITFTSLSTVADTVSIKADPDPSWDPVGSDVHMAYEWSTYNPVAPTEHAPGAVLAGPGDSYSYTVMRRDAYAGNPDYEVLRAIIGVHIDDSDTKYLSKKWGSILVNGKALPFVIMSDKDKRTAVPTDMVEIISDATLTGQPGSSVPPYIFDVKSVLNAGEEVRVTITNLRENGSVDGDAAFSGFVVNRIGAHVWYKKK